jgi:cation:H+ antiporter
MISLLVIFWIIIFSISIFLLVKSSNWFIESAEKIGLSLKINHFIVGLTIVAFGTSLPELISSIFAVIKNETEIVVANTIGSNLANILLIGGIISIISGAIPAKRNLIDIDAPLLLITNIAFLFIIIDKKINFYEAIILLIQFIVYLIYTTSQKSDLSLNKSEEIINKEKIKVKVFLRLILGAAGMMIGANYTIESTIKISQILSIPSSFIAATAIAVGTSLPELSVSVIAAIKKKYEMSLGNILGSNIFNPLVVAGVPALIKELNIDDLTFNITMPFFLAATLIFVISTISKKIHIWEGLMYIILYILFIYKLIEAL